MNENKRLIAVGAGLLALIVLILAISFWPEKDKSFACNVRGDKAYSKIGAVNYKQYQCLIKSNKKNAIVYTTKMNDKKKKALNNVATKLGHVIYYINTDKINNKDLKTIKKNLEYKDLSFKNDAIIIIKKGKVEGYKENILTKEQELKSFLKDAKLAKYMCDATPMDEYPNLAEVTVEQYKCLYESEAPFAIMLSQTTCGHCQNFKPFINKYVGKNNVPLYIIEVNLLSDEDRNTLLNSLTYFKDNESWGTPLTLGIKNKEVIAELSGDNEDESEVTSFFTEAGLLE